MSTHAESLIHAWIDDVLDANGLAELDHLLQTDNAVADRFVELATIDCGMLESVARHRELSEISQSPPARLLPGLRRHARSRAPSHSHAGPALAAAALLGIGIIVALVVNAQREATPPPAETQQPLVQSDHRSSTAVTRPIVVSGAAVITNASGAIAARSDVDTGDQLLTRGSVTLEWRNEASSLRLAPDSLCTITTAEDRKLITLDRGGVFASIARQSSDTGFTLRTPHGDVVVVGTEFSVEVDDTGSLVAVTEGSVAVTDTAGRSTLLAANQTTRMPLPEAPSDEPRIIGLALIDVRTGAIVPGYERIADGAIIDRAKLGLGDINLRIDTNDTVGSVKTTVNGASPRAKIAGPDNERSSAENNPPFSVAGDKADEGFHPWDIQPGTHRIEVTPFPEDHGRGKAGPARAWMITIR